MSVGAGVYIKQETDYVNTVPEQGCACPRSTSDIPASLFDSVPSSTEPISAARECSIY
jgi:hypothetical protein